MALEIMVFILILLSVPIGYLIAYLCRDELIFGRKWFRLILILSIPIGIYFSISGNYIYSLTLLFTTIVTLISLWKSFDKKLTRKKVN